MNKKNIKNNFLCGIAYAVGMSAFHYFKNGEFSIWDFLFYFTFSATSLWLINQNKYKKQ